MTADILKRDFQFPKCDKKTLWRFILSFILPNIVFLVVCFFLAAARPLINIDYILPCLLLTFKNKFIRILGVLSYIIVILLEAFTIISQFFNFLDLAALRDFIPFAFDAPVEYMLLYSLLIVFMIILPLSAWILNKKSQKFYAISFSIVILILFYLLGILGDFYYNKSKNNAFATDNRVIYSQALSISETFDGMFLKTLAMPAELIEYYPNGEFERAAGNIKQPYNRKILFIVAESLGSLKNEQAQQEVFRKISEQKELYEFFDMGSIRINGATVQGEIRELCNRKLTSGHDTRHFTAQDFSTCLPQILSKQGYYTVAFHGAGSNMYHRKSLYPKLGFQKTMFLENMQHKKRCNPFKGICDSEIFSLVSSELVQHDKVLVYWMTLTSHYPFSENDIFDKRFDCVKFNISADSGICRNIRMETQFIDLLAQLSTQPEMKGVEVLIVSDHAPSAFENNIFQTIRYFTGSYAHFKIKE